MCFVSGWINPRIHTAGTHRNHGSTYCKWINQYIQCIYIYTLSTNTQIHSLLSIYLVEVNRHRLMFLDIRKDPRWMCCRSSSIGPDQWNHGKVTVTGQVVLPNYDSFLGWCSFFKKKTTCAHVYKFFLLVDISDHFSTSSSTKLLPINSHATPIFNIFQQPAGRVVLLFPMTSGMHWIVTGWHCTTSMSCYSVPA